MTCGAGDIMTADKVDIIWTKLMPAAIDAIQSYLKVQRTVAPITVVSGDCGSNYKFSNAELTNGINATDFYILVSAGPVGNQDTLAYASPCINDPFNRPILGRINFNPYFLKWDSLSPSSNNDNLVQTAHHEIGHALGFTTSYFGAANRTSNGFARGKSVKKIQTPTVVETARKYFGCNSIDGIEIEDEGAAGSVGAHWDRRILFEELMTASAGSRMSVFTLSFFKDLGFYDVDMNHAIPLSFGKGGGCGFIDSKCNTEAGGLGKFWCNEFAANNNPTKFCTFDRRGIGYCNARKYSSALPAQFQYFSDPTVGGGDFVDKCPYVAAYSNRECSYEREAYDATTAAAEADLGFYFGAGGRCFDTGGLKRSLATTTDTLRCMKARCPFNGTRVEILVGNQWLCCPLDGSARDDLEPPADFTGSIKCPPASEICDYEISYGSDQPESKPLGNTELRTNEGTAKISAEVIFNGTGWGNVLASDRQRVDLFNSIRIDIARILRVSSASLTVRRSSLIDRGTIVEKGLSVLVGIIDDGEQAIGYGVFTKALSDNRFASAPIPLTRDAYARANPGSTDSTVIAGYLVEEKRSSSICSSSITPDHCIMIIGICVTAGAIIIIGILMYCLCFKSPFDVPPQPKGLSLA